MLVILDIDGVLADCGHRLHYLKNKDYDNFYSDKEVLGDTPIQAGLELLDLFLDSWDVELCLMTGRPYRTEEATRKWLRGIRQDYGGLGMIMRKDHDYRPSEVVKVENMRHWIDLSSREDAILFIDDDPKNVIAMEKAFPNLKGLVFGTDRLVEN